MRDDPSNSDHAFNLFVTAEHILDWKFPQDRKKQKTLRESDLLLGVTWDLASGAKHFKLYVSHKSVKRTKRSGGFWASGMFAKGFWAKGMFAEPRLVVELESNEADRFGESPTALKIAEQVLEYWKEHLDDA